jgi:hypothetical protein
MLCNKSGVIVADAYLVDVQDVTERITVGAPSANFYFYDFRQLKHIFLPSKNLQDTSYPIPPISTTNALRTVTIEPIWDLFNQLPIFEASGEQNKD